MPSLLRFTEIVDSRSRPPEGTDATGLVTLGFEDRRRSRMRLRLDDGREAALILPHGTVLRDGVQLRDPEQGEIVTVRAAAQTLSVVHAGDGVQLARAAYHLGNRHIPVQVGAGWLAYEHDHVLDDMIEDLGLEVGTRVAPFEPEAGGYRHGDSNGEHGHGH